MKYDKNRPVGSIQYDDKRASIPDNAHQGEEEGIVADEPKQSEYNIFRHEFQRGRDPELYWLNKYQNDDEDTQMPYLKTDIRSLYAHEDIRPEAIIDNLYDLHIHESESAKMQLDLFGDLEDRDDDELERLAGYYQHNDNWKNRLIQGDSLLVMNSLLNRENMKGQVQCIYFDPPYGIKYASNWQMKLNSRDVKDNDANLTGEPEMIKAFRDTWELGIHSYLSYLRDRFVVARELLNESGSIFVQISDENLHLVRALLDEVFGSDNFFSLITFKKTSPLGSVGLSGISDYIIWYAKDKSRIKYRQLFENKAFGSGSMYKNVELNNGERRKMTKEEQLHPELLPKGSRVFRLGTLFSAGYTPSCMYDIEYKGNLYSSDKKSWLTTKKGMQELIKKNRVEIQGRNLNFIRYHDDFPLQEINNLWDDTAGATNISYVVQTSTKVIQRCILMTTDPGDLVLDPTCGGGTTSYVSEQWGRRWITIDTSRIAITLAKKRLLCAVFPYFILFDSSLKPNVKQGFKYKAIPRITVKTIANNLPPVEEVLYDQPEEDKTKIRVSGPFTVETLQSLDVMTPESLKSKSDDYDEYLQFTERIFANLKANGIRNGVKQQQAVMRSVEHVDEPYLNAKGYYTDDEGKEHCVYFMIGPKFGTVSKKAVNEAIRAFRQHTSESRWLAILGFSFDDNIEVGDNKEYNFGTFQVSKVRMSDDLMQDGLLKKDKKAGSFIIIGEPDIELVKDDDKTCHVEIKGMDMYDPIKDDVKARNIEDIAYWEMDDNYRGGLFKVRSIHFCGGDKRDFQAWRKGLDNVAKTMAKKKAERTLRLQINEEVWDTLYGFESEPITYEKGKKIAVRVVSQFGEEATKVLTME